MIRTAENIRRLPSPGGRLALRWLQTNIAKAKEIARELSVTDTLVYRWAREDSPIPTERAEQIIWACKKLKLAIDRLDGETNLYLANKYSERKAA